MPCMNGSNWQHLEVSIQMALILMEKAQEIAARLDIGDFKASNGWLTRWKERNISQRIISGESGDISTQTVESWLERLPSIVEGYTPENIWNCDETGLLWKSLLDKGLAEKKKACKGGKKSKMRVTVLFFVNGNGKISMCPPVVVGKSAKPRCFKGIEKDRLPVLYHHQKKAWMDGNILNSVLARINSQLTHEKRKILLFMDNAGCHPPDLCSKYSNIKVVFLPPNTTLKLQPLDLGIIRNFKAHYRKLFMRYIITKIDHCSTATEVSNSVNILQSIQWISQAWTNLDSAVVQKCFRSSGMLNKDFSVVQEFTLDGDPFRDLDSYYDETAQQLQNLMQHACWNIYFEDEDALDIPTSFDFEDDIGRKISLKNLALQH